VQKRPNDSQSGTGDRHPSAHISSLKSLNTTDPAVKSPGVRQLYPPNEIKRKIDKKD